jgi:hypothetical protein
MLEVLKEVRDSGLFGYEPNSFADQDMMDRIEKQVEQAIQNAEKK